MLLTSSRVSVLLAASVLVSACDKPRNTHDAGPTTSAPSAAASTTPSAAPRTAPPIAPPIAPPGAAPPGDDAVIPPTFATFRFVLTATTPPCSAADCHGPGGPNRLQYTVKDADRLYETVTHHVSVDCGNIPVVNPGHPEKSALVKVLKGPCSAKVPQMPNGCQPALGNCLPANYVAAIEQWIALGAPRN